jgi:hypothetical protein
MSPNNGFCLFSNGTRPIVRREYQQKYHKLSDLHRSAGCVEIFPQSDAPGVTDAGQRAEIGIGVGVGREITRVGEIV